MRLTIKNIMNIKNTPIIGSIYIDDVVIRNGDNTYDFYFKHKDYKGGFVYCLHRDLTEGPKTSNIRYVGTFRHPYGSNRQDVYESDLLDKVSFIDFLTLIVDDWAVMNNL